MVYGTASGRRVLVWLSRHGVLALGLGLALALAQGCSSEPQPQRRTSLNPQPDAPGNAFGQPRSTTSSQDLPAGSGGTKGSDTASSKEPIRRNSADGERANGLKGRIPLDDGAAGSSDE